MELNLCPTCDSFVKSNWTTCRACGAELHFNEPPVGVGSAPSAEPAAVAVETPAQADFSPENSSTEPAWTDSTSAWAKPIEPVETHSTAEAWTEPIAPIAEPVAPVAAWAEPSAPIEDWFAPVTQEPETVEEARDEEPVLDEDVADTKEELTVPLSWTQPWQQEPVGWEVAATAPIQEQPVVEDEVVDPASSAQDDEVVVEDDEVVVEDDEVVVQDDESVGDEEWSEPTPEWDETHDDRAATAEWIADPEPEPGSWHDDTPAWINQVLAADHEWPDNIVIDDESTPWTADEHYEVETEHVVDIEEPIEEVIEPAPKEWLEGPVSLSDDGWGEDEEEPELAWDAHFYTPPLVPDPPLDEAPVYEEPTQTFTFEVPDEQTEPEEESEPEPAPLSQAPFDTHAPFAQTASAGYAPIESYASPQPAPAAVTPDGMAAPSELALQTFSLPTPTTDMINELRNKVGKVEALDRKWIVRLAIVGGVVVFLAVIIFAVVSLAGHSSKSTKTTTTSAAALKNVAPATTVTTAAAPEWIAYKDPSGKFSIDFPSQPGIQNGTNGKTVWQATSKDGASAALVSVENAPDPSDIDTGLTNAMNADASALKATVKSHSIVSVNGHRQLSAHLTASGETIDMVSYAQGKYLYTVMVVSSNATGDPTLFSHLESTFEPTV